MTGALREIDIRTTRRRRRCATSGQGGPLTYLGLMVVGLPQHVHDHRPRQPRREDAR